MAARSTLSNICACSASKYCGGMGEHAAAKTAATTRSDDFTLICTTSCSTGNALWEMQFTQIRDPAPQDQGAPDGYSKGLPFGLCGPETEETARRGQVRPVDHFAVEGERPGIGVFGERRHDLARPDELLLGRRKGSVDDRNLRRMDRHLGSKARTPGGGTLGSQPLPVPEG